MNKRNYLISCSEAQGKSPLETIKWMRRNFGDRGNGWDFGFSGVSGDRGNIWLELRDEKLIMMFEMWFETNDRQ
jgi:hypothetical protein